MAELQLFRYTATHTAKIHIMYVCICVIYFSAENAGSLINDNRTERFTSNFSSFSLYTYWECWGWTTEIPTIVTQYNIPHRRLY